METGLPHLVVTDFEVNSFTSTSGGGDSKSRPVRNRQVHSAYLKQRLENAWADAEHDEVVYHSSRNGIYLEIKGETGYELATKSLESLRGNDPLKWTRLLNIREELVSIEGQEEEQSVRYATLYVPHSKKELLFGQIEKYATEESISGKPKNATLLEGISNIRKALEVESFWQDEKILIPADEPAWCEVWLSSDRQEVICRFESLLAEQQIECKSGVIRFPERAVKIVHTTRNQLEAINRFSDDIAEYRRAKETAAFWLDQQNRAQAEWVETILERLQIDHDSQIAICILDTGINNGHPLIQPVLDPRDCQSVNPLWGCHDHDKHGTLMAGVSTYGNLQEILSHSELIKLNHCLESVKIMPPSSATEPELWGDVTAQGIYKAEVQAPDRKRIICMAVTSDDSRDRGRPSSWSAELDQLCSGAEDGKQRMFIVSSGNAQMAEVGSYPDSNITDSIHDPAQSWNALTVGAYTELDDITEGPLSSYDPIAPKGGLSPFSTTSSIWDDKWPIKPEILMEGGNLAKDATGFITECDDLSVLSTFYKPQEAHFYPFDMTSASTA